MLRLVAPMALRTPISRVRSETGDQHDVDDAYRAQAGGDDAHAAEKNIPWR